MATNIRKDGKVPYRCSGVRDYHGASKCKWLKKTGTRLKYCDAPGRTRWCPLFEDCRDYEPASGEDGD